jgi:hypothetical protein
VARAAVWPAGLLRGVACRASGHSGDRSGHMATNHGAGPRAALRGSAGSEAGMSRRSAASVQGTPNV